MEQAKIRNTIRLLSAVRLFKAEVNVTGAEEGFIELPDYILHNLDEGDSLRFVKVEHKQSIAEIVMSPGHGCLLHKHINTIRNIEIIKGEVYLYLSVPDDCYRILNSSDRVSIPCNSWHQMRAGTEGAIIKEISYYQGCNQNYSEEELEACDIDDFRIHKS